MEKAISIKGLNVSYQNKRVLTNIYLDIAAGQTYGVIGPNGAGKSTLFKSILGLINYDAGQILVFDKMIEEVRKKVAYVPQRDEVDWTFPATVRDLVMMGRYPHKRVLQRLDKSDHQKVDEALEKLSIENLADRQIGQLSGGQQQRVFIARAIAQEAHLFFFDEPFVGVDITTEEKIIQIMKDLAIEGKTVLVVHHDLSTVEEYFSSVVMINQRMIATGKTADVFNQENIAKCYGPQLTMLHHTGQFK